MPALTINELVQTVTDEEVKTMDRIEGLIRLRESLKTDQESLEELIGELIEQRREDIQNLGLSPDVLDEGLQAFSALYEGLIGQAKDAQFLAVQQQRE